MKRYLLLAAGGLSLSMGVAGLFLPLLPTTPFLLLAAACFLRSSQRLYNWLTGHKHLGPYIRNYLRHRAVSIKAKTVSIILLWATIGGTAVFAVRNNWVRIVLVLVAVGVTVHLALMKTLTPEMLGKDREDR